MTETLAAAFTRQQVALLPAYLHGPWGELFAEAHGAMLDALAQAMVDAVACSVISLAPIDALPALGAERGLERWPTETDAGYRARLIAAPDAYAEAGTAEGVYNRYLEMGLTTTIKANRDWRWDLLWEAASQWARMWIIVRQPHAFAKGAVWGSGAWGTARLGTDASDDSVRMLRGIALKWKGAHSHLVHVIIHISGTLWGDGYVWGTATWGGEAAYLAGD